MRSLSLRVPPGKWSFFICNLERQRIDILPRWELQLKGRSKRKQIRSREGKKREKRKNGRKKIRPHAVWVTSRYLNFPYRFGKFLCLTADIFARDPQDKRDNPNEGAAAVPHRRVKFMVDSGSDIVTLDDDIIKELQLPVKGCAKQEVPGGQIQEKPLYSACLGIGGKMLNVEVKDECSFS